MKKYVLLFIFAAVCVFVSCDDVSNKMSEDYPSDYTIRYGLRQVLQYDPMNINGIDVVDKFDFFSTLRFTIQVRGGKMVCLEFSNGKVPFSPFSFELPQGEVECVFDSEVFPNELRIKGTDHVIAYFQDGEFSIPFQLDSKQLNYKYTFKEIK